MNPLRSEDSTARLRRTVFSLLIVTSVGMLIGRIWTVRSSLGESPLLSANDRSRWATVRALVDHGTYQLDDVMFQDRPHKKRDREWYSIDVVRHKGFDGQEHYFSSKPPLLATLLAGLYWALKALTGAGIADRPFYVVRCLLILTNVVPLAVYFGCLARFVDRHGKTDRGRIFVMAAAVYGTFLTTFAVTLNNHVVAAVSAALALFAAVPIWREGERRLRYFAAAGFFAAFAVANELPALALFALLAAVLFCQSPWRTLLAFSHHTSISSFASAFCQSPWRTLLVFLPAAAPVAAASIATNYLAHGCWTFPYAHRSNGPLRATVDGNYFAQLAREEIPPELRQTLAQAGIDLSPQATVKRRPSGEGWVVWDLAGQDRLAIAADEQSLRVYDWDQWYEFEGSYWFSDRRSTVDRGEPDQAKYALHVLVGHHGVFSLTPLWLLSVVGVGLWLVRGEDRMRGLALLVSAITVVCLGFYLARPLQDRNYGGVACGFRWAFWLIPLWLMVLVPAADVIVRHRGARYLGLALLLVSVISASYACLNPWSQPWLYQYWAYLGLIEP